MVWIYGGAFQYGDNAVYNGHFLATRNVVVVSINYRLGKFGEYLFILYRYCILYNPYVIFIARHNANLRV